MTRSRWSRPGRIVPRRDPPPPEAPEPPHHATETPAQTADRLVAKLGLDEALAVAMTRLREAAPVTRRHLEAAGPERRRQMEAAALDYDPRRHRRWYEVATNLAARVERERHQLEPAAAELVRGERAA